MTTYDDCHAEPAPSNLWGWDIPSSYDLRLVCAPGSAGYTEAAADNADAFTVVGVPASVRPVTVALHLRQIAIVNHPDTLLWSAVAGLHAGAIVRGRREGRVVSVEDASHWTGRRCIGWAGIAR